MKNESMPDNGETNADETQMNSGMEQEKETLEGIEEAHHEDVGTKEEKQTQPEPENELEKLKLTIGEMNDKYLRLYSEFDNFRKRTQKEKIELYKTAGEDIMTAMLPVLDNLERAMKAINESTDIESVKQGIELIRQNLFNTLSQKGLKAMESPVNQDFNLDLHEAITRIPAPDKKLKGKVIDEVEKGYFLNDKVIRYAKVVIGE